MATDYYSKVDYKAVCDAQSRILDTLAVDFDPRDLLASDVSVLSGLLVLHHTGHDQHAFSDAVDYLYTTRRIGINLHHMLLDLLDA